MGVKLITLTSLFATFVVVNIDATTTSDLNPSGNEPIDAGDLKRCLLALATAKAIKSKFAASTAATQPVGIPIYVPQAQPPSYYVIFEEYPQNVEYIFEDTQIIYVDLWMDDNGNLFYYDEFGNPIFFDQGIAGQSIIRKLPNSTNKYKATLERSVFKAYDEKKKKEREAVKPEPTISEYITLEVHVDGNGNRYFFDESRKPVMFGRWIEERSIVQKKPNSNTLDAIMKKSTLLEYNRKREAAKPAQSSQMLMARAPLQRTAPNPQVQKVAIATDRTTMPQGPIVYQPMVKRAL